ncbi:MAG: hypothetical protein H6560_10775 [Lewinellaceae bacterium]|nr:hypothetical protein [Lewinellaceae bacterium]
MSIEGTKLNFITWIINLQDEAVLRKLMALKEEAEAELKSLEPAIKEALIHRAEESNRDIEAGRVFPIEEVMKEDWE